MNNIEYTITLLKRKMFFSRIHITNAIFLNEYQKFLETWNSVIELLKVIVAIKNFTENIIYMIVKTVQHVSCLITSSRIKLFSAL